VFGVLAVGILATFGSRTIDFDVAFPTTELGNALFTTWILPFEAVSILLLAALVGAIILARRD
jgi:NADH-quinone oxidoreductase subunit J